MAPRFARLARVRCFWPRSVGQLRLGDDCQSIGGWRAVYPRPGGIAAAEGVHSLALAVCGDSHPFALVNRW